MPIRIAHLPVGPDEPLFVIAELGLNHRGSRDEAIAMVDAAAHAGARAIKLQTLTATRLVARDAPAPPHVAASSMRDFFRQFELSEADHAAIAARARLRGLAFLSTPFDEQAVGLLESVGCDAYKIASGDLTNDRLIGRAARTGKPLLLSTGMSTLAQIHDALVWAREGGATDIVLLHCVSAYPVPSGSENLGALTEIARLFGLPIGLSDHGTDPLNVAIAVTLGASVYERHFILQRAPGDADAEVSATPEELTCLVQTAARARTILGGGEKCPLPAEAGNIAASRRGLYAARALRAGETITADDIVALRPAADLEPRQWRDLIGRRIGRDMPEGAAFLERDAPKAARPTRGSRAA